VIGRSHTTRTVVSIALRQRLRRQHPRPTPEHHLLRSEGVSEANGHRRGKKKAIRLPNLHLE
jgi:hypothetical protein